MSYKKEVSYFCGVFLSIIAILCLVTPKVDAAIGVFKGQVDPMRKGCIFGEEFFMFGRSQAKDFCGQVACDENCQCFMYSCDFAEAEPPCYTVQDKEAFYPDCCPRGICPWSEASGENFL